MAWRNIDKARKNEKQVEALEKETGGEFGSLSQTEH
jgi:hypothetical protein